jgi:hypothetical protein
MPADVLSVYMETPTLQEWSQQDSRLTVFSEETKRWEIPLDPRYQRAVALAALPRATSSDFSAGGAMAATLTTGAGSGGGAAQQYLEESVHALTTAPLTLHSFYGIDAPAGQPRKHVVQNLGGLGYTYPQRVVLDPLTLPKLFAVPGTGAQATSSGRHGGAPMAGAAPIMDEDIAPQGRGSNFKTNEPLLVLYLPETREGVFICIPHHPEKTMGKAKGSKGPTASAGGSRRDEGGGTKPFAFGIPPEPEVEIKTPGADSGSSADSKGGVGNFLSQIMGRGSGGASQPSCVVDGSLKDKGILVRYRKGGSALTIVDLRGGGYTRLTLPEGVRVASVMIGQDDLWTVRDDEGKVFWMRVPADLVFHDLGGSAQPGGNSGAALYEVEVHNSEVEGAAWGGFDPPLASTVGSAHMLDHGPNHAGSAFVRQAAPGTITTTAAAAPPHLSEDVTARVMSNSDTHVQVVVGHPLSSSLDGKGAGGYAPEAHVYSTFRGLSVVSEGEEGEEEEETLMEFEARERRVLVSGVTSRRATSGNTQAAGEGIDGVLDALSAGGADLPSGAIPSGAMGQVITAYSLHDDHSDEGDKNGADLSAVLPRAAMEGGWGSGQVVELDIVDTVAHTARAIKVPRRPVQLDDDEDEDEESEKLPEEVPVVVDMVELSGGELLTMQADGSVRHWQTDMQESATDLNAWRRMFGMSDDDDLNVRFGDGPEGEASPESDPRTGLNEPKEGKHDDKEHHGGNTWAGGTGGSDTAGLGGRGGPYRLDKGHKVHQVSEAKKNEVSEEAKAKAREMAEEALKAKLDDIEMTGGEWEAYEKYLGKVQQEVQQLRLVLEAVEARQQERQWLKHQTSGELDDSKIVDAVAGERGIFKRRGEEDKLSSMQQPKPKRLLFLMDVSVPIYPAF